MAFGLYILEMEVLAAEAHTLCSLIGVKITTALWRYTNQQSYRGKALKIELRASYFQQ